MRKLVLMSFVLIPACCFAGDKIKKHSETEIIISPEPVTTSPEDKVVSLKTLKANLSYLDVMIANFESGVILNRVKLQGQKDLLEEQIQEAVRLGVKETEQ